MQERREYKTRNGESDLVLPPQSNAAVVRVRAGVPERDPSGSKGNNGSSAGERRVCSSPKKKSGSSRLDRAPALFSRLRWYTQPRALAPRISESVDVFH